MKKTNEQSIKETKTKNTARRPKGVLIIDPETGEKRRVSKSWAAAIKLEGSIVVLDPTIFD